MLLKKGLSLHIVACKCSRACLSWVLALAIQAGSQAWDHPPVFLPGFSPSLPDGEQVRRFTLHEDIDILIHAPAADLFSNNKPVLLLLFALPNGNTIEQTFGKIRTPGLDWHYDIQHIGAQTRFIRSKMTDHNVVLVLLGTRQKSWPAWKASHPAHAQRIVAVVDSLRKLFAPHDPHIVLSGHSGGGRFTFSYLDGSKNIPAFVQRIVFMDSNYGYEYKYAQPVMNWLQADTTHSLMVFAYNDSVALLNGKRIVSDSGGTWHRSHRMIEDFSSNVDFISERDSAFQRYHGLAGRVRFYLKENPNRGIWHTEQVERNGLIHALFAATQWENQGYDYWENRAYDQHISHDAPQPIRLTLPERPDGSMSGRAFAAYADSLSFDQRENAIFREISRGNMPEFLRHLALVRYRGADAAGDSHTCILAVTPDYLAIGDNRDFFRMPMGPGTAQKIADVFGAVLPTRKMVDQIYRAAAVQLEPLPYFPRGNRNELLSTFMQHQQDIQAQCRAAAAIPGPLTAGHKKDVVIGHRLVDAARPDHLLLYGWHKPDGQAIQPLTNVHISRYVDYSHGVRLIHRFVDIDGQSHDIEKVLQDTLLYALLSDEPGPLQQTRYSTAVQWPRNRFDKDSLRYMCKSAVATLQTWHNPKTGLWETTGWWNAANIVTLLCNYQSASGDTSYMPVIRRTFALNRRLQIPAQANAAAWVCEDFINDYYDDEAWWALAWLQVYGFTHDSVYLETAKTIFVDLQSAWDDSCGGGIYWKKPGIYKNAISNGLFLYLALELFQRTGEPDYFNWAKREAEWLLQSGVQEADHLVVDGLDRNCAPRGRKWTYNQGVLLAGYTGLYTITRDSTWFRCAQDLAHAVIRLMSDPSGVLHETDERLCNQDQVQFKGIFMRHLSYYARVSGDSLARSFILRNAESVWRHARNPDTGELGLHWLGPWDGSDAGRHSSACEALIAALQQLKDH